MSKVAPIEAIEYKEADVEDGEEGAEPQTPSLFEAQSQANAGINPFHLTPWWILPASH
jgi:hypothetical protein